MNEITITKKEFMEKAAEVTMNFINDENTDKSNSSIIVLLTAMFTSALAKELFDKDIQ